MLDNKKYIPFYKSLYTEELIQKASQINLLAFDVDGVLTDGGLYFDANGNEEKRFFAQDGHGIKIIQSIGIETMIISGRETDSVLHRGRELGIEYIIQGSRDKFKSFNELFFNHGFCYLITFFCLNSLMKIRHAKPVLRYLCLSKPVLPYQQIVLPIHNISP